MTLTSTVPAYRTFDLEVAAVARLSPTFVRVTLTGDELAHFHDGGPGGPRDTRVKLVVPATPGARPRVPINVSEPDWYRRWLAVDPARRGHLRTYTVRRLDLDGPDPLLVIDFALHLDEAGGGGPATVWAAGARPGDPVTLLGPNRAHPEPGGLEWHPPAPDAGARRRVVLVGDETALPAIASILRTLPVQYDGEALVELPCIEDAQQLTAPPGVRVTYLPRNDRPRGSATLAALADLLPDLLPWLGDLPEVAPLPDRGVAADDEVLWDTPAPGPGGDGVYAWVAGEASVVKEVRRMLVRVLPRDQVAFMGYWRQGRAEG